MATRIAPSLDESARMLGASGPSLLARVHWPLLKRSAAAALLIFVDVMKELRRSACLCSWLCSWRGPLAEVLRHGLDSRAANAERASHALAGCGSVHLFAVLWIFLMGYSPIHQ